MRKFILHFVLLTGSLQAFSQVIIPNQNPGKQYFTLADNLRPGEDYLANTVIFKVKPEYRANCKKNSIDGILALQDYFSKIGAQKIEKIFPDHTPPALEKNEIGQPLVDLSLIYSFQYTASTPLEEVINKLRSSGYCEYVEPSYIPKTHFTPNDGGAHHLQGNIVGSINAQDAWNLTQGNPAIIIGIVDTGTEPTHPDLAANYAGGYDVAMNDPDPTWQGSNHGVAISGIACAVTNNGIGIASPAFNCKFKAIKATDAAGMFTKPYEGIVWAADNGCKIINCSWGGNQSSAFDQNMVDYAAINKNCLILCSSGNSGLDDETYPGSYNNTYRVAGSTSADEKAGSSSYGYDVDFAAPANLLYTTINGTGYGPMSGTSMGTGVASGAAALVQSYFNYVVGAQIGEKLKQTCDPYMGAATLSLDSAGKLGKGRIDVYNALTQSAKSIVMNPIIVTDGNDDLFMPGENLSITGTFINYLDPSTAATSATLSIVSGPGVITGGTYPIGALATLGTHNVPAPNYAASINASAGLNAIIKFKITITDGTYSSTQYFDIQVNPTMTGITIHETDLQIVAYPNPTSGMFTITSKQKQSHISIFNLLGEEVYSRSVLDMPMSVVNLSSSPSGIYFLQVRMKDGIATKKIIKE